MSFFDINSLSSSSSSEEFEEISYESPTKETDQKSDAVVKRALVQDKNSKSNPFKKQKPSTISVPVPMPKFGKKSASSKNNNNIFDSVLPPPPPKPGYQNKTKNLKMDEFFKGNAITVETDESPINMGFNIPTNNVYKRNGVTRNLFMQPEGSKSCWTYCVAMLASDLIREGKSLNLGNGFLQWLNTTRLADAQSTQTKAQTFNIDLEHSEIPLQDPLKHLKTKLLESGHSVLVSIEHDQIQGHAIVIDAISDTHTTLRDPFTGKAWNATNEYMKEILDDDGLNCNCLSLKTESD